MSVVIPTRDRPDRLRKAVAAVLEQDYAGPVECIVVFDRTEEVPLVLPADPARSVVTLANHRAQGPAGARNAGADVARSDLLAFCDDDDVWHPHKLRRQVEALAGTPDASAVTCGIVVRYGQRSVARVPARNGVTLDDLIRSRDAAIHTSTLLVRRMDFLDTIGPFDESMPGGYGEDYEWLLRAASRGRLHCVREPLVSVLWHDASWFDGRWDMIVGSIDRLLELHPEIARSRPGLGRLFGRLAFAHAAAGRRREALRWTRRTLALNAGERRAYVAAAVALGLPASTVLRFAHATGRGI